MEPCSIETERGLWEGNHVSLVGGALSRKATRQGVGTHRNVVKGTCADPEPCDFIKKKKERKSIKARRRRGERRGREIAALDEQKDRIGQKKEENKIEAEGGQEKAHTKQIPKPAKKKRS